MALLTKARHFVSGIRSMFGKEREEQEMDEELRSYLESATREKMRCGMSRAAA
jgi:hypothetical protein